MVALHVSKSNNLIIISNSGIVIRMEISQISTLSRNTQGVRLINLKDEQKVSATAIIEKNDDEDENVDKIEENDNNQTNIEEKEE